MGMIQQEAAQSEDLKYTIADVATTSTEQRTHNNFLAKKKSGLAYNCVSM